LYNLYEKIRENVSYSWLMILTQNPDSATVDCGDEF